MTTKARIEAPAGAEAPVLEKKTMVWYKDGQHFEVRSITQAQFKQIGIEAPKDVHWTPANGFVQSKDFLRSFMDENQYANVILADPRFEEVEVDV